MVTSIKFITVTQYTHIHHYCALQEDGVAIVRVKHGAYKGRKQERNYQGRTEEIITPRNLGLDCKANSDLLTKIALEAAFNAPGQLEKGSLKMFDENGKYVHHRR